MGRQSEISDQLRFLLASGKIRGALELLNQLSTCRFTALHRFDASDLQNLVLIDRDVAAAPLMDTIPVGDSYCAFVQASRSAFLVDNALTDARLEGHPKQPVVQSYVGIPLTSADGNVFGTLCHFDFGFASVSGEALALTEQVASFLDPDTAVDALFETIQRNMAALGGMQELIFLASEDYESGADAFEEYAKPVLDAALGRLPPDRHAAIEQELERLRQALRLMDWPRPTAGLAS